MRHLPRFSAGVIALVSISGCDPQAGTEPSMNLHDRTALAAASPLGGAGGELLKELHAAVSRFHSTKQAEMAGYLADPHCVEVEGVGAMGHHWVNPALVDGVFEPTRPEALLYAPDERGKMRFLGVEYIVLNTGQPAPAFDGQPFDVRGTPDPRPHWTLHVWLAKKNPSGLFAPLNPDVTCP